MRHTAVAGHLKPEEIKDRMLSSESRQQFQRWQVIYITVTKRLRAEEVSELVGVCTGTVHQWVHQYNHKGPDVFILQGRGGRRRELLSWNEEEELLEELREKGERGAIVISRDCGSLRSNLCGGRHTPDESVFPRRGPLWPYE